MISDPRFYFLAVPVILLTGISKSGFGGALGGLAVPLLSLAIPPAEAAAIMLPILCVMDVAGIRRFAGAFDWRNLRILLPGALAGVAAGTLCFGLLNEGWLLLLVGAIGVGFPAMNWLGVAQRQAPAAVSVPRGAFWSALSGFTSFICHNGGAPLLVYLLPQRLERRLFVGTTVMFFFVVNYAKLVPYYFLGQLRLGNLSTSAALLPLAPAGVYLGLWLQHRISNEMVYRTATALLFATGWKLIWDGARMLLR
ncbi:MAG TPA: sulfite exporter TauE/SafE family protein [Burkholderiales bacterium]|nr:sulfite exporter TauE/SafE family protein [Burkholderiales bacterium]